MRFWAGKIFPQNNTTTLARLEKVREPHGPMREVEFTWEIYVRLVRKREIEIDGVTVRYAEWNEPGGQDHAYKDGIGPSDFYVDYYGIDEAYAEYGRTLKHKRQQEKENARGVEAAKNDRPDEP